MNEAAILLTLFGFVCAPVECQEVMYNNELVACCVNGEAYPPVTMCGDRCERVDVESEFPSA